MLGGFGLELSGGFQIRDISKVDAKGIAAQFPAQLTDGLQVRGTLNVSDGAANFGDNKVKLTALRVGPDAVFDFVGNVRNHLDGLSQIVSAAFLLNHRLVNLTGGNGVVHRSTDARVTLVMAQVQIGLHTVFRHIAFPVFVGVQRARIDVDVRVEFLDGNRIAARLEKTADAGRNDSFTQGGDYASCHENKLSVPHALKTIRGAKLGFFPPKCKVFFNYLLSP